MFFHDFCCQGIWKRCGSSCNRNLNFPPKFPSSSIREEEQTPKKINNILSDTVDGSLKSGKVNSPVEGTVVNIIPFIYGPGFSNISGLSGFLNHQQYALINL